MGLVASRDEPDQKLELGSSQLDLNFVAPALASRRFSLPKLAWCDGCRCGLLMLLT